MRAADAEAKANGPAGHRGGGQGRSAQAVLEDIHPETAGGPPRTSGSTSPWSWPSAASCGGDRVWREVSPCIDQYKLVSLHHQRQGGGEDGGCPRASLTDMLRNDFRLTSVKKGCEVGECGACNVLIDGEAFNSCIYLAVWAEGKRHPHPGGPAGPERRALRHPAGLYRRGRRPVRLLHPWLHHERRGDAGQPAGSTPTTSCGSCSPATCAAAPAMRTSSAP